MNKRLTIPSIAFLALVMGLSTVVMSIPQAYADGECLRGTGLEPRSVDVFQFDQRLST